MKTSKNVTLLVAILIAISFVLSACEEKKPKNVSPDTSKGTEESVAEKTGLVKIGEQVWMSQNCAHFEILGDDNKKVILVEFHIEKDKDAQTLQTFIKYWKGVLVFDKEIRYKDLRNGMLGIECEYSLGAEEICAYINEFVYQVGGRIESVASLEEIDLTEKTEGDKI